MKANNKISIGRLKDLNMKMDVSTKIENKIEQLNELERLEHTEIGISCDVLMSI